MLHNEDYAHDEINPQYESITVSVTSSSNDSDIVIFSAESNLAALKPSFEYLKLLLSQKRKKTTRAKTYVYSCYYHINALKTHCDSYKPMAFKLNIKYKRVSDSRSILFGYHLPVRSSVQRLMQVFLL